MEETLLAFGIILLLAVLVVPFVALGLVLGARKRIVALEAQLEARRSELRYLYDQLTALKKGGGGLATGELRASAGKQTKEMRRPSVAEANEISAAATANEIRAASGAPNEFRTPSGAPNEIRTNEIRVSANEANEIRAASNEIRDAGGGPNEFRTNEIRASSAEANEIRAASAETNEFRAGVADSRDAMNSSAAAETKEFRPPNAERNEFPRGERNEFPPDARAERNEFRPGERNEFRPGERNEFPRGERNEFPRGERNEFRPDAPGERNEFRPDAPGERNEFRAGERNEFPPDAPGERNEFRPGERNEFRPGEGNEFPRGERNEFPRGERNEFRPGERNEFRPGAGASTGGGGTPRSTTPTDRPQRPPRAPAIPFEQRLATYFTRIGAGALLLGALYFFKYAADNEWIGPAGRVLLGSIAGVAILAFAEYTRKTTRAAYTQILVGVGLALLYICAWASAVLYQLVSIPTAFLAETVILFAGAALAYRYRGEAVLILVLVAGFANPVLLSTGVDRPLALFSYLFLLTGVAVAVSVAREFKLSIALSIAGVTILFGGWYAKYFDVHDFRGEAWAGDRPPEELVGAYHELQNRIVPLAAAAAFTLEWLATAFVLHKRDLLKGFIKPITVIAILIAHVAATALLYDRPQALGLTMIGLAALSVAAFRYFDTTRFLLVPMSAAFLLLAGLTADTRTEDQMILLGLFGAWAGIYLVAFLRDAWRSSADLPKSAAIQASIGLALFSVLGLIMLFSSEKNLAAAGLLAAVSIGFIALGVRAKSTGLILVALLGTLIPLLAAGAMLGDKAEYAAYSFLAIAAAWSLLYAGAIVRQVSTHKETKWLSLITLSIAGLAGLALALVATSEQVPTMRALITGSIGVVDLLLALWIRNTRPELDGWVRILAAQALALFAPAVAFGLSGATITVAWAVLAGTAMLIFAEAKDKVWLAVASLLIIATLVRVFAFDIAGVEEQLRTFEWSQGRQGILQLRGFLNPRGYALAGTGLAFLGGALLVARTAKHNAPDNKTLPIFAAIVITIAYALLTAFLIVETRTALQHLPPAPPMPLDNEEFALFMETVRDAKAAQHNLLAMTTTVILSLVAMLLLGIGFAAKDPFHRYLGLALFLGTVGKLVLWDVWNLARIYQVVVLGVVGALLLGSGFLYARLKAFFKGEATAAAILAILATTTISTAKAAPPEAPIIPIHLYESTGTIEGVQGPGDYRLHVPAELYQKSTSQNLFADLRVADDKNHEIPFVLRIAPPLSVPHTVQPRMFDPGQVGGGGFRATFELPNRVEHCEVALDLRGDGPFMRRTKIETGERLDDLQVVSKGAIVYAVDVQGVHAQSSTLRYPPSLARYLRVTLQNDPDAQLTEIYGATLSCNRADTLPRVERVPLAIVNTATNKDAQTTEIELDAGSEGVPIDRLILKVKTQEFVRRVQVLASSYKTAWPSVGSSVIYKVGADGAEGPESVAIPISETRKRNFKLVIFDGNDAPIEVVGAEGSYSERELIFRTPSSGAHAIYIGDKTSTNIMRTYDLADILERRSEELKPRPATLGPITANPTFGKAQPIGALPITERYRSAIGAGLAAILVLLGAWAVRLIRTTKAEAKS